MSSTHRRGIAVLTALLGALGAQRVHAVRTAAGEWRAAPVPPPSARPRDLAQPRAER